MTRLQSNNALLLLRHGRPASTEAVAVVAGHLVAEESIAAVVAIGKQVVGIAGKIDLALRRPSAQLPAHRLRQAGRDARRCIRLLPGHSLQVQLLLRVPADVHGTDGPVVRCMENGVWDFSDLRCEDPVCVDPGRPPDINYEAIKSQMNSAIGWFVHRVTVVLVKGVVTNDGNLLFFTNKIRPRIPSFTFPIST